MYPVVAKDIIYTMAHMGPLWTVQGTRLPGISEVVRSVTMETLPGASNVILFIGLLCFEAVIPMIEAGGLNATTQHKTQKPQSTQKPQLNTAASTQHEPRKPQTQPKSLSTKPKSLNSTQQPQLNTKPKSLNSIQQPQLTQNPKAKTQHKSLTSTQNQKASFQHKTQKPELNPKASRQTTPSSHNSTQQS